MFKNPKILFSLRQGYFVLDENEIYDARKQFCQLLQSNREEYIRKRVNYFKNKIGVEPKNVRVMNLRKRWASRSKTGLNFHWKIMLAPITIIDYIIVHELAYYREECHTLEFSEVVGSLLPNYVEKRNWLRLNGASLDTQNQLIFFISFYN